ncbi:putative serine threonine protein kinase domain protein, partial [Erysiphe neolycopersici]
MEHRVPCIQIPIEPQVSQINQEATSIINLSSEQLRLYEFMYNQYRTNLQTYKEQQKSLASIQQYIIKTVGNYYSTIEDEHDVAEELVLLKRRAQPSDWVQRKEILIKYQSILNSPNRTDLSLWVTNWQKALTNAKRINLPEAEGLRPTQSFLESIHQIDNSFSDYWTNKLEDEARKIFERTQSTKANMSSQSTSFAVFKGQNSSDVKNNTTIPPPSNLKKPLCPCGWSHYYAECYYINKKIRPTNFKPSTERLQKVETFLMDPANRKKVESALEKSEMFKLKQTSKLLHKNSNLEGDTVQASAAVTTAVFSKTPESTSEYPLRDSFILDSGSDGHICNDFSRFSNYYSKFSMAVAGSGQSEILGYGTILMRIPTGLFQLNNVAYIPSFHTSLASLIRLQAAGISWNPQTRCIFTPEKTICFTERKFNQYVIEYNELKLFSASTFSSKLEPIEKFITVSNSKIWHERLGHPSNKVLQKVLTNQCKSPTLLPKELPKCEPCKLAKAQRIVKRTQPSSKATRPFYRIFIDLFSLPVSYNNKKVALLIKDDFTKIIFFYPIPNSTSSEIIKCFASLQRYLKCQFSLEICVIHRDNDVSLQSEYKNFINQHGIEDEPTAPYTPAQNGSAERSGGVISMKARTMRVSSNLPEFLWPEIWKTAVFLYNRIPHQGSNLNDLWKSPMEKLYKWLQDNQKNPPLMSTDLSYLRAYGCKAYPLTIKALKNKEKRHLKLEAHAEVGYLVGYDSSNIFRIYIPSRKEKRSSPLPQFWSDLAFHPLGKEFIEAGHEEWNILHERKTFYPSPIPRHEAKIKPLPLTWSFAYKFNKHGYLRKVKSRICVRGDLQPYSDKNTYAATLAARNFRILTAIIAKFDLEARSLDAINAFTNADLDEVIYVYYPEGLKSPGFVLQLSKALYGLRRSPLLWQKDLSTTFKSLGLDQSSEEPCIFFSSNFLVFFFVDDIIVIFQKQHRKISENFILQLKHKYDLTDRGNLSSFLGIRITRDREQRKVWITQD